jgi:hypothetical protein
MATIAANAMAAKPNFENMDLSPPSGANTTVTRLFALLPTRTC